jgi:hypothetical protein
MGAKRRTGHPAAIDLAARGSVHSSAHAPLGTGPPSPRFTVSFSAVSSINPLPPSANPAAPADVYFRDLVRALGRSCEGRHSFVVVDAPLLRAEQLREVMSVGQVSGPEVALGWWAGRPGEREHGAGGLMGQGGEGY